MSTKRMEGGKNVLEIERIIYTWTELDKEKSKWTCTEVILVKEETVNKRIFEDIKKKKYTYEKLDQVINNQEDYLTNDSKHGWAAHTGGLGFFFSFFPTFVRKKEK